MEGKLKLVGMKKEEFFTTNHTNRHEKEKADIGKIKLFPKWK